MPGLSLRFALAAIYEALREGKSDDEVDRLDDRLGLYPDDEPDADQRLGDDVPTSVNDPVAAAMLAELGESLLTSS